jgi:hypothetical protein
MSSSLSSAAHARPTAGQVGHKNQQQAASAHTNSWVGLRGELTQPAEARIGHRPPGIGSTCMPGLGLLHICALLLAHPLMAGDCWRLSPPLPIRCPSAAQSPIQPSRGPASQPTANVVVVVHFFFASSILIANCCCWTWRSFFLLIHSIVGGGRDPSNIHGG